MNHSFNFFTPTQLIFGSGRLEELKEVAPKFFKTAAVCKEYFIICLYENFLSSTFNPIKSGN